MGYRIKINHDSGETSELRLTCDDYGSALVEGSNYAYSWQAQGFEIIGHGDWWRVVPTEKARETGAFTVTLRELT